MRLSNDWSVQKSVEKSVKEIEVPTIYQVFGKRCFDLIVTLLLSLLLLPVIFLVVFLVRMNLGAPILFRQERPGLGGKPFRLYKFRTMLDGCDAQGNLLPDAERLTRFGRFLRSTSLDELPELFNVWRGEMSLVGPRPLLMEYLARYTPEEMHRHALLPGITGWAQVNGRNAITWTKKFELDLWYVDHLSLWLDLKILAMTLRQALRSKDINQPGQVTMQKFTGTAVPSHVATNLSVRTKRVLILGAGGHAQVIADILLRAGEAGVPIAIIGYLDDNPALTSQSRLGIPILGVLNQRHTILHDAVILGIGQNATRMALFEELNNQGENFITACHPRAIIAPDVVLGPGTVVCAGAVINTGSRIGANVIINTASSVDHHNRIGNHAHIAPGVHLGGDVVVGTGALVGIGATVMPQRTIGAWSTVGAGALVHQDVAARTTVIGTPARPYHPIKEETMATEQRQPSNGRVTSSVSPSRVIEPAMGTI